MPEEQNKQTRYPGTQPFSGSQSELFFGRLADIVNLSKMIELEQMVLVYAKSGIGKTSLIEAGVLPNLAANGNYTFQKIRYGAWTKDTKSTASQISAQELSELHETQSYIDKIEPNDKSLWYYAKMWQLQQIRLNKSENQTLLLVFDQFEELFTYPQEQVDEFNKELAELLFTNVPQRFINQKELLQDIKPDYITAEEEKLLFTKPKVKILFAIRSDRMSELNKMSDYIPRILLKHYELSPLSVKQATRAICEPADLPSKFVSNSFKYSDEALKAILFFLTKGNTQINNIESFQLQILCHTVERKVITDKMPKILLQHIEPVKDIYQNFYNDLINGLPLSTDEKMLARIMIEDGLIEEATKRRLQLAGEQILHKYKIDQKVLGNLVNERLLRTEERDSFRVYELAHDTLVEPILESSKERKEIEAEESAEAERKEEIRILHAENERKEREKQKVQAEKDRADKLLEKSQQLLRHLVPDDTASIYKHFEDKAETDLQYCNFEAAARNYLFAWLAFDLPAEQDVQMNKKVDLAKYCRDLNNKAIEHYRHFRYAEAEALYLKLLKDLPDDEIILKRIDYCKNPIFNKDNFVLIKGGDFIMGDASDSNNPKHRVRLTDFYLNKYEVTNAEYAEFLTIFGHETINIDEHDEAFIDSDGIGLQKNKKIWHPASEQYTNHPVVKVSWYGANEFCKFWNMKLPSEAQWEFAGRSRGKDYKYSWGNDEPKGKNTTKFGNIADISLNKTYPQFTDYEKDYDDGYAVTSPVASFDANELGLFDMSGNVYEWCEDWYDSGFYKKSENEENPINFEITNSRVLRGGSWNFTVVNSRMAFRGFNAPSDRNGGVGFRLSLVP